MNGHAHLTPLLLPAPVVAHIRGMLPWVTVDAVFERGPMACIRLYNGGVEVQAESLYGAVIEVMKLYPPPRVTAVMFATEAA